MYKLLKSIRAGVPKELPELAQLGRSLWKRHREILAYFDVGASNGPVEAINGRLEHLRGIALGFRNLSHYILREVTDPLRTAPESDQRTLNPEGPTNSRSLTAPPSHSAQFSPGYADWETHPRCILR